MLRSRKALSALALLAAAACANLAPNVGWAATSVTPEQDYANRCAAAGVLTCQGFDDASVFNWSSSQTEGLYPIYGTTTIGGVQDTSVKVSGNSSLRFNIVDNTGADVAGNFSWNFGKTFSQNSTFYVQFSARFDSNFVNTNWGQFNSSPKLVDFYDGNGVPCAQVELTTVEYYGGGIPTMYSACGARSVTTSPSSISLYQTTSVVPYLMQQGASASSGYDCAYGNLILGSGNGTGCFKYPANTWMTFYYKVSVGTWGSANSSIQSWVSVNGGTPQEWINVSNFTLQHDASATGGYNRLMFTPYMTGKSTSATYATAYMWIDELVVSTQAIAWPGATSSSSSGGTTTTVVPDPPSNVSVQ
jgi:hypothetical protein